MALYDTADLLRRCKRQAKRPASDSAIADTDWYAYLSDAQRYWMKQISILVPTYLRPIAVKLDTTDNIIYTFPSGSGEPLGRIEVYADNRLTSPLTSGALWDMSADFYWEDDGSGNTQLHMTANQSRVYGDGPYAVYIPEPADISSTQAPTIKPMEARLLCVAHAVAEFMREGGIQDPSPFLQREQELWQGDPLRPGDWGIRGALLSKYGANTANRDDVRFWWRGNPDLSTFPQ